MTPRTAELQKDYREDEEALQFATGARVRDRRTAPLKPAKGLNGPPHGGNRDRRRRRA